MENLEMASGIRRAVAALARRLRTERSADGLSLTKLSLLAHLYPRGSMTAAELAVLERVQPQSLTRALAELVKGGLVSRRPDTHDRRRWLLDITVNGRALLMQDMQERDAWLATALTALSATEQELLRLAGQLLQRLADAA